MHTLHRQIYRLLLRLHPVVFRDEFAHETALDFEEALYTFGLAHLLLDAASSLARQWFVSISFGAPDPVSVPRPSLLGGNYVMVRDRPFTSLELGFGLIASAIQIALCLLALSASPGHRPDMPIIYVSSSTSATRGNGNLETPLPKGGNPAFAPKPPQSPTASRGFAVASPAQTTQPKPELFLFHPSVPLPSYEVATIKPLDPDAARSAVKLPPGGYLSPLSLRRYIMNAYGAVYAPQIVGGPAWLNKDAYVIKGKVPDALQSALQKMPREERIDQNRMLEQSLLADRFHLKAHFETRVLPVYELVPANGGLKITEVPAPPERKPGDPPIDPGNRLAPGTVVTTPGSSGLRALNGRAIKMQLLARIIGSDIGDRPIVNHTGFTGYFDVTGLTWAPLADSEATSEPDALSLSGALKENLGVRIVTGKDPIEVLVIDDIERPTPN
jgi:uncharacterized protein (TIGR03435 family)